MPVQKNEVTYTCELVATTTMLSSNDDLATCGVRPLKTCASRLLQAIAFVLLFLVS